MGGAEDSFEKMEIQELSNNNIVPSFARGMSILVVDYDTTSLMYLASLLEQYSYKVTTTELASVALSMIQEDQDQFKVVIANINMPEMSSLSFLRVILKRDIPVIFLASQINVNFAERALAEGVSFFMEKPISSDDLKYVWQHVYRTGRRASKETGKRNYWEILNCAGKQASDHDQTVKINSQAGGIANDSNDHDLHSKNNYNLKNKQKGVVEAVLAHDEENGGGGSTLTTFTEHYQYSKESSYRQGVFFRKTKMILMSDDNYQKEKKMKSYDHSGYTNVSNDGIVKSPLEAQIVIENNNKMNSMNKSSDQQQQKKNRRILWTPELHKEFTAALSTLGDKKARPKLILQKMNLPNLTQRQVASHLQKYKAQVEKISQNRATTVPTMLSTPPSSALFGRFTGESSSSKIFDKTMPLTSLPGHEHFAIPGMTQGVDSVPGKYNLSSSGNMFNAGTSVPAFTESRSLEVNKSTAALAPPADPAPPVFQVNQNLQLSPEYADLMKLLEEDPEEEFQGLGSTELNPGDVDRYCQWLTDALQGENDQQPLVETHQKQFNL
ncbi:hypothetical protein ACOSP7_019739 [Xanthoceras sorbifolium]